MKHKPEVLLDRLITHLVIEHPLPWSVPEGDWTQEVTAADGTIIVKCMSSAEAEAIIALAEESRKKLDAFGKKFEEAMRADDVIAASLSCAG